MRAAAALLCALVSAGVQATPDEAARDLVRERETRFIFRAPETRKEPDLTLGRSLMLPPRVTLEAPRFAPIGAEATVELRGGLLPLGMVLEAVSISIGYTPMYVRKTDDQIVGLVPDVRGMSLTKVLEMLGSVYGVSISEMPDSRLLMVSPHARRDI